MVKLIDNYGLIVRISYDYIEISHNSNGTYNIGYKIAEVAFLLPKYKKEAICVSPELIIDINTEIEILKNFSVIMSTEEFRKLGLDIPF